MGLDARAPGCGVADTLGPVDSADRRCALNRDGEASVRQPRELLPLQGVTEAAACCSLAREPADKFVPAFADAAIHVTRKREKLVAKAGRQAMIFGGLSLV